MDYRLYRTSESFVGMSATGFPPGFIGDAWVLFKKTPIFDIFHKCRNFWKDMQSEIIKLTH